MILNDAASAPSCARVSLARIPFPGRSHAGVQRVGPRGRSRSAQNPLPRVPPGAVPELRGVRRARRRLGSADAARGGRSLLRGPRPGSHSRRFGGPRGPRRLDRLRACGGGSSVPRCRGGPGRPRVLRARRGNRRSVSHERALRRTGSESCEMLSRHTVAIGRSPSTVTIRSLTVKEKILLHLFDYNRFAEGYEAPPEVTQEAIAQAVGIRVHHVNQYVKPLISESFVEERTSHVRGRARRRKVYFLTPSGRGHVAALRGVLLEESVPLQRAVGEGVLTPLARIYQEERRGSSLLELLQELAASGAIAETSEVRAPGTIEFTQEAVRPERFYGRRAEIDGVLRAVAETPMVVVTGMAGIGKTALGAMVCEEL